MQDKISVANLAMLVGAVVAFIFLFMAFFKEGPFKSSAWDTDGAAFASTVPAILAIVMAVWIVLELAGVSLPEQVLTFNHDQLKATWGISAFGIMLSWISADFGGIGKGAGFWLMFVGSLVMAGGSIMVLLGKGNETVNLPTGGSSRSSDSSTPPPAG